MLDVPDPADRMPAARVARIVGLAASRGCDPDLARAAAERLPASRCFRFTDDQLARGIHDSVVAVTAALQGT
jgi:hypothetical protein